MEDLFYSSALFLTAPLRHTQLALTPNLLLSACPPSVPLGLTFSALLCLIMPSVDFGWSWQWMKEGVEGGWHRVQSPLHIRW